MADKLHAHTAYASINQDAPDGMRWALPTKGAITVICAGDSIDTMLPDGSFVHYGHNGGEAFYERVHAFEPPVYLRGERAAEAIRAMQKRWPGRHL